MVPTPWILGLILSADERALRTGSPSATPSPTLDARREAESSRRLGVRPATASIPKAGLKKLRGAQAAYPELPPGTRGSGNAMHEVLVGPNGKVASIWPLREPAFDPPFPDLAKDIVDALLTWEYEPLLSEGRGVPVCVVVTTHIRWQ